MEDTKVQSLSEYIHFAGEAKKLIMNPIVPDGQHSDYFYALTEYAKLKLEDLDQYTELKSHEIHNELKTALFKDYKSIIDLACEKTSDGHHFFNFLRKCNYCKLIWLKVSGCTSLTACGRLFEDRQDEQIQQELPLQQFIISYKNKKLTIIRNEKQELQKIKTKEQIEINLKRSKENLDSIKEMKVGERTQNQQAQYKKDLEKKIKNAQSQMIQLTFQIHSKRINLVYVFKMFFQNNINFIMQILLIEEKPESSSRFGIILDNTQNCEIYFTGVENNIFSEIEKFQGRQKNQITKVLHLLFEINKSNISFQQTVISQFRKAYKSYPPLFLLISDDQAQEEAIKIKNQLNRYLNVQMHNRLNYFEKHCGYHIYVDLNGKEIAMLLGKEQYIKTKIFQTVKSPTIFKNKWALINTPQFDMNSEVKQRNEIINELSQTFKKYQNETSLCFIIQQLIRTATLRYKKRQLQISFSQQYIQQTIYQQQLLDFSKDL